MSRKASPWENAYQESFYSQVKLDLGDPNRFKSLGALIAEIYRLIFVYNYLRINSKLKISPAAFVARQLENPKGRPCLKLDKRVRQRGTFQPLFASGRNAQDGLRPVTHSYMIYMGMFKPTLSKVLLGLVLGGITWQLGIAAGYFAAGNRPGTFVYYLVYIFAPTSLLTLRFMDGVHERLDNILYYLFIISQFLYGYVLTCLIFYIAKKVFRQDRASDSDCTKS